MKEELITFETAKLAKDKGFYYMKANCYGDNMCYQLPEGDRVNALKANSVAGYILAPTQSLLQKWLRETHDTYIESTIDPFAGDYWYKIKVFKGESEVAETNKMSDDNFNSYEEALEKGLQEALKLIK